MDGFFTALSQHAFLQTAVATALLASIGCGVMGTYVVVKRIAFIAGGIAHSVLGGMGAAVYFGFEPLHGALPAAIVAALLIGWVRLHWRRWWPRPARRRMKTAKTSSQMARSRSKRQPRSAPDAACSTVSVP